MVSFKSGGDPEDYMGDSFMQAPDLSGGMKGGKGGVSPIAAFLNLIGVGRTVAQGPKKDKKPAEGSSVDSTPTATGVPEDQAMPGAPVHMSILDDAESSFKPMQPISGDWGRRYLDSIMPIKTIDPNKM